MISDPELGLDYSRVVHGDQRFMYTRPMRAGDRLTVTRRRELKSLAGNDILDIRGEVTRCTASTSVTAYSKLVARGTAGGRQTGAEKPRYDDVEVGTELPGADLPGDRATW